MEKILRNKRVSFGKRVKSFSYLFVFLILIWLALTLTFNREEFLTGIFVSFIIAILLSEIYVSLEFPVFTPKRFFFFLVYIFVLFREIVKANFDVAYRVIHPKMPIKPGIVVIKTNLKSSIAKLFLANSITLTPGTFTLDILGDKLLIHWINVKEEDIEETTKIIGRKFERYLKEIFE